MTKVIRASNNFKDWYMSRVEYTSTRNGHYLIAKDKPSKRLEKEAHAIFESFGGFESSRFKWEFTYDSRPEIESAIHYGYIQTPQQNWAFLPPQIEKTMSSFLVLPTNSEVLYPYYGYGYDHHNHQLYNRSFIRSFVSEDYIVDGKKYDAVFFRPPLKNDFNAISEYTSYLKSGGLLVCIVSDLTLRSKKLDELMSEQYMDEKAYAIPHPTWIPLNSTSVIKTHMLTASKK